MRHAHLAGALLACATAAAHGACPEDFVRQLSGDALTRLQKQDIGIACKGQKFTLSGEVWNAERETDGTVIVWVKVKSASSNQYASKDEWKIVLATPAACGDPGRMNKGAPITVTAEFVEFAGFSNRHANAAKAACR